MEADAFGIEVGSGGKAEISLGGVNGRNLAKRDVDRFLPSFFLTGAELGESRFGVCALPLEEGRVPNIDLIGVGLAEMESFGRFGMTALTMASSVRWTGPGCCSGVGGAIMGRVEGGRPTCGGWIVSATMLGVMVFLIKWTMCNFWARLGLKKLGVA